MMAVFISFPLLYFAIRNNFIFIVNLLASTLSKGKGQYQIASEGSEESLEESRHKKSTLKMFYILTLILLALIVVLGMLLDELADVYNILGSVFANLNTFIFPTIYYITLIRQKNKRRNINYSFAWTVLLFAIPLGIFFIFSNIFIKAE